MTYSYSNYLRRAFLALAMMVVFIRPAVAETYTVTSTSCTGPESITAAMDLANANPGTDTISITPGLQIDARVCPPGDFPTPDADDYYFLQATESVIIEGNGAKLTGSNIWIAQNGAQVQSQQCYDELSTKNAPGTILLSASPGLIRVGVPKADNSAITVTARDLEFDNLGGLALVEENASFVLEDARVLNLVPSTRNCAQNLIKAYEGANVTLRGNTWVGNAVHGKVLFGYVLNGLIQGYKAGDLTIEDSYFSANGTTGMMLWNGQAGSEVKIVSSRFNDTGGIAVGGAATSYIVNSIWSASTLLSPGADDRTSNQSSEDMNIIASTFLYSNVECDVQCQSEKLEGGFGRGWLVRGDGNINFVQSAVEVAYPEEKGDPDWPYVKLLDYDPKDPASGFTADGATWIRPTPDQDADALKAVTGQPGLLTEQPAFGSPGPFTTDAEWATPLIPGELIDRIENAACGQANELLNPVDGSCIAVDVLGNPRVDGNDKRNIGAVQVDLAPHLVVSATGDGTVDLSWTKPRNPTKTIDGYTLQYREKGTTTWTDILLYGGDTLTSQVTALTNGTEYEFRVDSFVDGYPAGYWSNVVTATPYGPIGAPVVTATPGNGEVALSWTQPPLGGREFNAYTILWRVAGTDEFTGAQATYSYVATTATVTGLKNGTTYEFAVAAKAGGDVGPQGLAMATPHGDIGTVNRSPDASLLATVQANRPRFWEREPYHFGDCAKYEVWDGFGSVWEVAEGDDLSALILKSDLTNDVWRDPEPGSYGTASAKDISHVILCTTTN